MRVEPLVYVPLERLRALLSTQGMRIVGEAEAKVLDACAAVPLFELSYHGQCEPPPEHEWLTRVAKAELARRAQQKEKPHA